MSTIDSASASSLLKVYREDNDTNSYFRLSSGGRKAMAGFLLRGRYAQQVKAEEQITLGEALISEDRLSGFNRNECGVPAGERFEYYIVLDKHNQYLVELTDNKLGLVHRADLDTLLAEDCTLSYLGQSCHQDFLRKLRDKRSIKKEGFVSKLIRFFREKVFNLDK